MQCARSQIAAVLMLITVAAGGCGGADKPCMSMGAMSDVLGRASIVRLDIYDASAHCSGATVAEGAAPPTMSKVASAGQPIKLDVPAGRHVLLLSAFGDATGTVLLGSACIETDVKADQPACFNLMLAETPDLAEPAADVDMAGGGGGDVDMARQACTPAPDNCPTGQYCATDGNCAAGCKAASDCASTPVTPMCKTAEHRCVQCLVPGDCPLGKQCSPSGTCVDGCIPAAPNCNVGQQCCANLCIDVAVDLSNCGSCGRACSSSHVTTPSCMTNLCKPQCENSWGDCTHPIAPAADDGCETNLHDPAHCGMCGKACSLTHATATCPTGTCQIAACAAGYSNCDNADANGCECADLGDANHGCCPTGGCEAAHGDGFAHAFADCTPFGTYSVELARAAAKAYNAAGTIFDAAPCGPSPSMLTVLTVCNQGASECVCWAYADSGPGHLTGFARRNTTSTCMCPTGGSSDKTWK